MKRNYLQLVIFTGEILYVSQLHKAYLPKKVIIKINTTNLSDSFCNLKLAYIGTYFQIQIFFTPWFPRISRINSKLKFSSFQYYDLSPSL